MANAKIVKEKNTHTCEISSIQIAPGEAITTKSQNNIITLNYKPIIEITLDGFVLNLIKPIKFIATKNSVKTNVHNPTSEIKSL